MHWNLVVMKFKIQFVVGILLLTAYFSADAKPCCGTTGVCVQVLGSGGPEINDGRASSGYLVWQDGRARVLVDMGPGSMLRYEESGARLEDLEVVLLSHLHVDHSADLPALIKGSFFTDRSSDLPLYGPGGNALMPATTAFVQTLFADPDGAYHYLSGYLTGDEAFRLLPRNVDASGAAVRQVVASKDFNITAVAVHHGPLPALAWRIDLGGKAIAFSGDMNGDNHTLPKLAAGADLLVAHHAIPQDATGVARNLHMPPSVIGEIAAQAKVKQLVLSHRMIRTLGREAESTVEIRKHYAGPVEFAEDGQCFTVD
jgi:ribonuclease BN (tRNA processing enzyme)